MHFFSDNIGPEREHRLLHMNPQGSPEVMRESIMERLKTTPGEAMMDVMDDIQSLPSDELQKLRDSLGSEQMQQQEREHIDENLKQLQTVAEANSQESISQKLVELQGSLETRITQKAEAKEVEAEQKETVVPKETQPKPIVKPVSYETTTPLPVTPKEKSTWESITGWIGRTAEGIKDWSKENLDVTKWSGAKIATVATVTLGVASLVYLFKRSRGSESKSSVPWYLLIPGIGVSAYLLHKVFQNFDWYSNSGFGKAVQSGINTAGDAGEAALEAGSGAYEGGKKGIEKVKENLKSFEGAGESTRMVLDSKDVYKTNAEFYQALTIALATDGCELVVFDGVPYLYKSGKYIVFEGVPELVESINTYMSSPDSKFSDVVAVYTSTGVVYASSFGVLDFLYFRGPLGTKKALIEAVKRSGGWPIEILRKSGIKHAFGYLRPGPSGTLARTEFLVTAGRAKYTLNRVRINMRQTANVLTRGRLGNIDENGINALHAEWKKWHGLLEGLGDNDEAGTAKKIISHYKTSIQKQMSKAVEKLYARGGTVQFLEEVGDTDLMRQIQRGQIDEKQMSNVLEKTSRGTDEAVTSVSIKPEENIPHASTEATPPPRKAAGAEGSTPQPAPKPNESPSLRVVGPDDIDEAAETATELSRKEKQLQKIMSSLGDSPEDVTKLLEKAVAEGVIEGFDTKTLMLVKQDKTATSIFRGALESGDAAEVTRAMNAARKAARFRIGMNAVGGALDVFGIYMALADYEENGNKIRETNNPDLQRLYANSQSFNIAEGGVSATGLVVSGVAFANVLWSGGGMYAALAAPAGVVMLPIGIAAAAGGMYYRTATELTERSYKSKNDWERHTDGDLLAQMMELPPGHVEYREKLIHTPFQFWEMDGATYETIQKDHVTVRDRMTFAYTKHLSFLPRKQIGVRPNGEAIYESNEEYDERKSAFAEIQRKYIYAETDKTSAVVPTHTYQNAHNFAELIVHARELQENGDSDILTWDANVTNDEGILSHTEKRSFDLAHFEELQLWEPNENGITGKEVLIAYQKRLQEQKILELNLAKVVTDPSQREAQLLNLIQSRLLNDLRYNISRAEANLRNADLEGWDWGFGSEWKSRDAVRWHLYSLITKNIGEKAQELYNNSSISEEQYNTVLGELRTITDQPTESLLHDAKIASELRAMPPMPKKYEGQTEVLTSIEGIESGLPQHYAPQSDTGRKIAGENSEQSADAA